MYSWLSYLYVHTVFIYERAMCSVEKYYLKMTIIIIIKFLNKFLHFIFAVKGYYLGGTYL